MRLSMLALLMACMVPHSVGSDFLNVPSPPICILGIDLTSGRQTDTLRVLFHPRPLPATLDSVMAWTQTGVVPNCDLHIRTRPHYLRPFAFSDECRPVGRRTAPAG